MSCIYSSVPRKLTDGLDPSLSKEEKSDTDLVAQTLVGSRHQSEVGKKRTAIDFGRMISGKDEEVNQLEEGAKMYRVLRCNLTALDKESSKYDGVTYRNPFRVTGGPIYLVGVQFFGPAKVSRADYTVKVVVETPSWAIKLPWHYFLTSYWFRSKDYKVYGEAIRNVSAEKGDLWQVLFDYPIYVPPGKWVEINFYIMEGEKELSKMKPDAHKMSARIFTDDGIREFNFQAGSCQMPVIDFIVNPEGSVKRLSLTSASTISSNKAI